jgi:hypothetical protein
LARVILPKLNDMESFTLQARKVTRAQNNCRSKYWFLYLFVKRVIEKCGVNPRRKLIEQVNDFPFPV